VADGAPNRDRQREASLAHRRSPPAERPKEDDMPTRRTQQLLTAILVTALLGTAWSSGLIELDGYRATFDPDQDFLELEGELDCTPFGGPAAVPVTETSGRLGEGDYLVYQPADWNGDLVLFAHGANAPFMPAGRFWFPLPLGFDPQFTDMFFVQARDAALCHGFAWAASASERYGVAVEELMRSTHLLGALASHHLSAAPHHTFVTGVGYGGLSALALAESYPHRYAGAIAVDAEIGGMRMGIDEVMHVAALFDVIFPDLAEHERERGMTPPEFDAFAAAFQARVQADPTALQRMAAIHMPGSERYDPAGVGHPVLMPNPTAPDAAAAFMSLGENAAMMMWNYLVLYDDVLARGGGAFAGDNQHVVYRGEGWSPEDLADLNARVPRYAADAMAVRYWTFHYEPSGALQVPLVSIRPPWGAYPEHAWAYADRVNRAGVNEMYSDWHIASDEQFVPRQNMATALLALVDWVETGTRPTWPTAP
jgi:pimeloyl-ACP methyl ester carboxylesterase